jgi:hypothetical protein
MEPPFCYQRDDKSKLRINMTKSELKAVAVQLLANSKSLREVANPDSDGFKSVSDWLYKRESALLSKYQISKKDIYQLVFAITSHGSMTEELSLED